MTELLDLVLFKRTAARCSIRERPATKGLVAATILLSALAGGCASRCPAPETVLLVVTSKTGGPAPGFCERRVYADGTLSLDTGEAPVCKKSPSTVTRRFRELAASKDLRSSVHEVAASRNHGWYEDAAELVIRLDETRAVLPVGKVLVPVPIEALFAEIDAAFAREYGKAYRVRLLPEGYVGRHVEEPAP